MTTAEYHPDWCDPEGCSAYGLPELEPIHRSKPFMA